MSTLDWIVLIGTLLFIVIYGTLKTRGSKNIEGYFRGNSRMRWWTIGFSIMATQASAITFLSTPGQAFEDGMRFVQFYFGLPIAMVILCVTVLPIYYRLKVYTAYEYLETRFDLKTRILTAFLFLIQRGLAAGITIYAPSIILSTVLGIDLEFTIIMIGLLVIIYTVSGGTRAVAQTHLHQMIVIMGGMGLAFVILIQSLPPDISLLDAVHTAGKMGKMNVINLDFDVKDKYNIWSGMIGALFLFLSYFGTDQSQVARYIGGSSLTQSRLGLIFNGLLKIPMQFIILFIGTMVFVFYQFNQPPVFFNQQAKNELYQTQYNDDIKKLEQKHQDIFEAKRQDVYAMVDAIEADNEQKIQALQQSINKKRNQAREVKAKTISLIQKHDRDVEKNDTDYVFITFIMENLPVGVVGLLFAVIFSAAMSSTSSELNALASTTVVDMYKRNMKKNYSEKHYLVVSKIFTALWGVLAICFAIFASLFENLIEAVNMLGSVFYGTILGIFLAAFYFKYIKAMAVFMAALAAELLVIYLNHTSEIAYLWFNLIGCLVTIGLAFIIQYLLNNTKSQPPAPLDHTG